LTTNRFNVIAKHLKKDLFLLPDFNWLTTYGQIHIGLHHPMRE